jgi:alpha-mannosidase II
VFQHVYLDVNSNALDVVSRVDVRATSNYELAMRFKSADLQSEEDQFYTDLNGFQVGNFIDRFSNLIFDPFNFYYFQMIRRKRFDKLPLQAHFYPMTTAAFLDSNQKRLTLLGRQALGVASLNTGQIEVILDRRLLQDDDRGLAQVDNTQHR